MMKNSSERKDVTSRELMKRVMKGEKAERIPSMPQTCHDTGVRVYDEDWIEGMRRCLEDPILIHDYVIRLSEEIGCDGMRLFPLPKTAETVRKGDEVYQLDPDTDNVIGKCDLHGGGWIVPVPPPPVIETLDEARKAVRARIFSDEQIDQIKRSRERVPDFFVASGPGGLSMDPYTAMRGRIKAYEDLFLQPDFVQDVHEMILEMAIENCERLLKTGIDAFYMGDAASSASLISPKHFEEFSLPAYQKFSKHFSGTDILIYLHVCGNSSPILELMADSGMHCIEPLDSLAGVSVEDAKRRVGDRVVLMGGVHTLILADGTPEEVRKEAVRCCLEGGPYRYILASADMVPPGTSLENLKAMTDVATNSQWRKQRSED